MIADYGFVEIPLDNWWAGMYTKPKGDAPPKEFEPFEFYAKEDPEFVFHSFNLPSHVAFRAGLAAGFGHIERKPQYCDPAVKDHPDIRRYIDTLPTDDYLLKFKFAQK